MKNLIYAVFGLSVVSLIITVVLKFSPNLTKVANIRLLGFFGGTVLLGLLAANLALIELLNRK